MKTITIPAFLSRNGHSHTFSEFVERDYPVLTFCNDRDCSICRTMSMRIGYQKEAEQHDAYDLDAEGTEEAEARELSATNGD